MRSKDKTLSGFPTLRAVGQWIFARRYRSVNAEELDAVLHHEGMKVDVAASISSAILPRGERAQDSREAICGSQIIADLNAAGVPVAIEIGEPAIRAKSVTVSESYRKGDDSLKVIRLFDYAGLRATNGGDVHKCKHGRARLRPGGNRRYVLLLALLLVSLALPFGGLQVVNISVLIRL